LLIGSDGKIEKQGLESRCEGTVADAKRQRLVADARQRFGAVFEKNR
jgi:hypothetical protein